jgi:hypothetical protein
MKYETRAVLAEAYKGMRHPFIEMHTHTIEFEHYDADGRVLCSRVKLSSLADPAADDETAPPTCPTCLRRDPRFT